MYRSTASPSLSTIAKALLPFIERDVNLIDRGRGSAAPRSHKVGQAPAIRERHQDKKGWNGGGERRGDRSLEPRMMIGDDVRMLDRLEQVDFAQDPEQRQG